MIQNILVQKSKDTFVNNMAHVSTTVKHCNSAKMRSTVDIDSNICVELLLIYILTLLANKMFYRLKKSSSLFLAVKNEFMS